MAREIFGGAGGTGGGSGTGGSSNIRVSVRWYEQTVFAGDDVRCRITFSNAAQKQLPQPPPPQPQPPSSQGTAPSSSSSSGRHPSNSYHPDRARPPSSSSVSASPAASSLAPPAPLGRRHHRASHSISGPPTSGIQSSSSTSASTAAAAARRRADSIPWAPNNTTNGGNSNGTGGNGGGNGGGSSGSSGGASGHGRNHRRSLSIVSISSAGASDAQSGSSTGSPQLLSGPSASQNRPIRGHSRASSLQIGSRGSSFFSGPRSATNPSRPFSTQPSPLFNSSFPPTERSGSITGLRGRLTGSSTMPNTPSVGSMSRNSPRVPSDGFPDFKFPAAPAPASDSLDSPSDTSPSASTPEDKPLPALPIRFKDQPSSNPAAPPAQVPTIYEGPAVPSEARVLSTTSIAGTPRSSGEFYSLSNHSTETLASEYVSQQPSHPTVPRSQQGPLTAHRPPPHARQISSSNLLSPPLHGQQPPQFQQHQQNHPSRSLSQRARTAAAVAVAPETLMMGYAQIQGSFTLDGSLVNLNPFEQVKRKGVVGGQGGGVIGVETNKRDSGLLRGFGWGSLASSLGDLLGGGELSTIKEMRDMASSKSVPLLSTPQSVLFVDLRLAPGESKTYEYTFRLPKGLPPTHRGKVMKIAYGLVIGTQRPGTAKEQRVKSIEVPFRVLGSVNNYGEILGHDLMSPYILLRDQAVIQSLSEKERGKPWTLPSGSAQQQQQQPQQVARRRRSSTAATITGPTLNGFLIYVDELLKQQEAEGLASIGGLDIKNGTTAESATGSERQRSGLLSPTAVLSGSRRASSASSIFWADDAGPGSSSGGGRPVLSLSSREAIDLAILRSNIGDHSSAGGGGGGGSNVSANRFEIARNGRKVGTVMLARPAYRLGETVTMVVDFANADIRCYAVHAALETAERIVDPSLALRSEASIQRVTRRVYASLSEATLYARRFVFTATIPAGATPEFVTSGVSLEWKIRVEFVVPGDDGYDDNNGIEGGDDYDLDDGEDNEDEDEEEEEDEDDYDEDGDEDDGEGSSLNRQRQRQQPRASRRGPDSQHAPRRRRRRQHPDAHRPRRLPPPPPMLEEISRDDRGGLVLVAAESLRCESFEAAVPLRVYGWSGDAGGGGSERDIRESGVVV